MRFSTTTGWPIRSARCAPTRRAIVSPEPPGPNGTTNLSGFDAIDCAADGAHDSAAPRPSRPSAAICESTGIEHPPRWQRHGRTTRIDHPGGGRMIKRRDFFKLGLAVLAAQPSPPAFAQPRYPDRPIRLVVPFPPGGGFDAIGRPWAEKIKPLLGSVVIENIGGGGSSLGAAAVARARPDGYTILLGGSSTHVTEVLLKSRPLYDPLKDLEPISNIAVSPFGLAIHPSVPARTLPEFIAYAKANPGKLSYGHAGVGALNHLTGEMLKSLAGIPDFVHVPYRGSGPATTDALAGQISMVIPAVTGALLEYHRTGKLWILAVTGAT